MATADGFVSTRGRHRAELVLAALLEGVTVLEAAARTGISERTIHRYLKDEKFQAAFRDKKRSILEKATLRLSNSVDEAITTLIEIHKDKIMPPASRAQCAVQIIKAAYLNMGLSDVEERLQKLEESRHGNNNVIDQKPIWSNS
jgi:hypothetical protein